MRRSILTLPFLLLFMLLWSFHPENVHADTRVDSCQCTDYVYGQRPDIPDGMGHAKDWLYSSRVHRFPYDQIPQVGDIAVILNGEFGFSGQFGHVAMVTEVNEERSIFSIEGWDGFKNDCHVQIFLDLPVTKNTYFIHQILEPSQSSTSRFVWPHRFREHMDLNHLDY